MKHYEFDAVIIGSGAAGYNCADTLYDLGIKNIAVVTEGRLTGTSRNTGSDKQTYYKISLAGDNGDSVMSVAQTLFSGGAMDGDIALAEAANSAKCFIKLANLGVPFPVNKYGEYVGYKTDHDPYCRATSIGPYTSKKMTEVLEKSVISKGIEIIDSAQVIRLLVDGKKVTGLLALDLSECGKTEYISIKTPYIVMATGGPAAVYYDSVYPECHTGTSELALFAGASFSNLCEWQYGLASVDFRWNVSGTYQQVLPRYISVDSDGTEREFLREYFSDDSEMLKNIFLKGYEWPFDVRKIYGSSYIDLLVYRESVLLGRKVYLDFRREPSGIDADFSTLDEVTYSYLKNSDALIPLPINRLKKMNAGAIELYKSHGIDLEKEPLRIAVCAQHCNGGIEVDSDWQTDIIGLYAAGEAAGTFGIFRPGGSALNSTQVGGLRAAEHIAFSANNTASERFSEILEAAVSETEELLAKTKGGKSTVTEMRMLYQKHMSKYFMFLRSKKEMESALRVIEEKDRNFADENKWSSVADIPHLLKNYGIVKMQRIMAHSMLYAAEHYGSRGSAYVIANGDFMERKPVSENEAGRKQVVIARFSDGKYVTGERAVRPIPQRDLWFEKVWNDFIDQRLKNRT